MAKMMFEHRRTGGMVQYVGTHVDQDQLLEATVTIEVVKENGWRDYYFLEDFLFNFELVPVVSTLSFTAPVDDPIWEDIKQVAAKYEIDYEEDYSQLPDFAPGGSE